jgi:hypothetical protein
VAHVPLPEKRQIEEMVIAQKKAKLMEKYRA